MSQALASAKKRALVAPSSRFGGPIPSASAVNGNAAFTNKSNTSSYQSNNLSSVQSRINGTSVGQQNIFAGQQQPQTYNPNAFSAAAAPIQTLPTPPQLQSQQSRMMPPVATQPQTQSQTTQLYSALDSRLTTLEMTLREINDRNGLPQGMENVPSNTGEILEEYSGRFDIIAEELASLKNTIISLQKYTMEVNKILFEERMMTGGASEKRVHFEEQATDTQDIPVLDISASAL